MEKDDAPNDAKWLAENVVLPAIDRVEKSLKADISTLKTDMQSKDDAMWAEIGVVRKTGEDNRGNIRGIVGYLKGKQNGISSTPLNRTERAKQFIVDNGPQTTAYTIIMGIVYLILEYWKNGGT